MTTRRHVSRPARATWHRCFLVASVGFLPGCTHGEPFTPGTYPPGQPYSPGPLSRLTFNLGTDRTPAWLPDGSGILYSLERADRPDLDRCLGILPASGGTLRRVVCDTDPLDDDSADVIEWPAVAPDGRLAYVRASGMTFPFRSIAPDRQEIVLGTVSRPLDVRVLRTVGYTIPGGRTHDGVSHVRWLDGNRLVFVGEAVSYPHPCLACPEVDTVRSGIELVTLDLTTPTPAIAAVPGTDGASSVAVATSDTLYFTVNGDSRVFRYAFSSGQTTVAHDFGLAGVAREVQVVGSRLIAVVGGVIPLGGGYLHVVNLATGTDSILPDTTFRYRRPALTPDGRVVVVEALTNGRSDLWLVELP